MWQMLNNPWFIGIGGGILSGLVVTWLSRLFLSKKEDREYLQKVAGANRDVIYAIRPGISEGQIPSGQVIEALRHSTARRYSIDVGDIYTIQQLSEELIKEVMDSSFISSGKKSEFCEQLSTMVEPPRETLVRIAEKATMEIVERGRSAELRQRYVSMLSVMAGLLTASMTVFAYLNSRKLPSAEAKIGDHFDVFLPALVALSTLAAAMVGYTLQRQLRRSRESIGDTRDVRLNSPKISGLDSGKDKQSPASS